MVKHTVIILCLITLTFNLKAQEIEKKERKSDHYIGLQANFLIREILNIGGNNTNPLQNPYGLVYHSNSKKNNWGIHLGLGPRIYSITNNNGNNDVKSDGYDLSLRLGVDKRYVISSKWEMGTGLDALINVSRDHTINNNINFQGHKSDILTESLGLGGGLRGYLRYAIHPKIWLGTEASLNMISFQNKNRIKFTDDFGNITQESDEKDKSYSGSLSLPLSIYMFIKF